VGTVHLDATELARMNDTIRNIMVIKQPYLKRGYNLKQLSEDTSIPLHQLSAFINQYYHIHFNDLINEYRVYYCQNKIKNDEWKAKTLEAIAEESGFNNRNTFTAAFKKVTGANPSEFLRTVKQQKIA
jgi:YesN/AraC family two-component response regulator